MNVLGTRMGNTLVCKICKREYVNVGALPQTCNDCWKKHNSKSTSELKELGFYD